MKRTSKSSRPPKAREKTTFVPPLMFPPWPTAPEQGTEMRVVQTKKTDRLLIIAIIVAAILLVVGLFLSILFGSILPAALGTALGLAAIFAWGTSRSVHREQILTVTNRYRNTLAFRDRYAWELREYFRLFLQYVSVLIVVLILLFLSDLPSRITQGFKPLGRGAFPLSLVLAVAASAFFVWLLRRFQETKLWADLRKKHLGVIAAIIVSFLALVVVSYYYYQRELVTILADLSVGGSRLEDVFEAHRSYEPSYLPLIVLGLYALVGIRVIYGLLRADPATDQLTSYAWKLPLFAVLVYTLEIAWLLFGADILGLGIIVFVALLLIGMMLFAGPEVWKAVATFLIGLLKVLWQTVFVLFGLVAVALKKILDILSIKPLVRLIRRIFARINYGLNWGNAWLSYLNNWIDVMLRGLSRDERQRQITEIGEERAHEIATARKKLQEELGGINTSKTQP